MTYYMNRLQNLKTQEDFFVSLNSASEIDKNHVLYSTEMTHPIYTAEALKTQEKLSLLNSKQLAFAGSYFGYGFHEDAVRAGTAAAHAIGGQS